MSDEMNFLNNGCRTSSGGRASDCIGAAQVFVQDEINFLNAGCAKSSGYRAPDCVGASQVVLRDENDYLNNGCAQSSGYRAPGCVGAVGFFASDLEAAASQLPTLLLQTVDTNCGRTVASTGLGAGAPPSCMQVIAHLVQTLENEPAALVGVLNALCATGGGRLGSQSSPRSCAELPGAASNLILSVPAVAFGLVNAECRALRTTAGLPGGSGGAFPAECEALADGAASFAVSLPQLLLRTIDTACSAAPTQVVIGGSAPQNCAALVESTLALIARLPGQITTMLDSACNTAVSLATNPSGVPSGCQAAVGHYVEFAGSLPSLVVSSLDAACGGTGGATWTPSNPLPASCRDLPARVVTLVNSVVNAIPAYGSMVSAELNATCDSLTSATHHDCSQDAQEYLGRIVPATPSDSDGDGVADTNDWCPDHAGPATNYGCPEPDDAAMTADMAAGYSCPEGDASCTPSSALPEEESGADDAELDADGDSALPDPMNNAVLRDAAGGSVRRYRIHTGSGWTTMRNQPRFWVTGLAHDGWGFDWWVGQSNQGFRFGYVGASAGHCFWLKAKLRTSTGVPGYDCKAAGASLAMKQSEFMSSWTGDYDKGPYANCVYRESNGASKRFCDGRLVRIDSTRCPVGATVLANVRPWLSNYSDVEQAGYAIPAPQEVRWRYVTKDGRYVMMRDPHSEGGATNRPFAQDWGFIPSQCIAPNDYGIKHLPLS